MKLQENVVSASTFPLCPPLCTPRPPFVNHFSPFRATFLIFFPPDGVFPPKSPDSEKIFMKSSSWVCVRTDTHRCPLPTTPTSWIHVRDTTLGPSRPLVWQFRSWLFLLLGAQRQFMPLRPRHTAQSLTCFRPRRLRRFRKLATAVKLFARFNKHSSLKEFP